VIKFVSDLYSIQHYVIKFVSDLYSIQHYVIKFVSDLYSIQHYVIKFVGDLRRVSGFLWVLNTTLCDQVCQWLATGLWFFLGTPVSSTNKADSHDITEILLKVVFNTITITHKMKPQKPTWEVIVLVVYIGGIVDPSHV
jgi:hypothetical protein